MAGLNAWCNATAYFNTIADVSAYAGQTVQFRMRLGSDSSVSDSGWDVDDVTVQSCQTPTAVTLTDLSVNAGANQAAVPVGLPIAALPAAAGAAMAAVYLLRRRR